MKIKLKKTKLKSLTLKSSEINIENTPNIAGGVQSAYACYTNKKYWGCDYSDFCWYTAKDYYTCSD